MATIPATAAKAVSKAKMVTRIIAVERPPRMGQKQIFLPNFTLTLLRTPEHGPYFASFIVPLNLNKLDLRDYLFNGYGVRVRGVRSFIQQQKVRQDKPGEKRPAQRKHYRPRAVKKMMVELERPFAWPEEPTDYSLWDKDTHDAAAKDQEEFTERMRPDYKQKPTPDRSPMEQQAREYLEGKRRWQSVKGEQEETVEREWEDIGEAKEVETDVVVPRS